MAIARGDYVQELQRKEQGGGFKEIEADEHVMRKQFVESHVAWQGWLRSKVRGQKRSFVLEKWPFRALLLQTEKHRLRMPASTQLCRMEVVLRFRVLGLV